MNVVDSDDYDTRVPVGDSFVQCILVARAHVDWTEEGQEGTKSSPRHWSQAAVRADRTCRFDGDLSSQI